MEVLRSRGRRQTGKAREEAALLIKVIHAIPYHTTARPVLPFSSFSLSFVVYKQACCVVCVFSPKHLHTCLCMHM